MPGILWAEIVLRPGVPAMSFNRIAAIVMTLAAINDCADQRRREPIPPRISPVINQTATIVARSEL